MKILSVVALAVGVSKAQDFDLASLGNSAAEAIAADAEINQLLSAYEATAPAPGPSGPGGLGRSSFSMADILSGGRQLPPGINLMDFVTPQGTFDTMSFLIALKGALLAQAQNAAPATEAPTTTTTTTTEAPVEYELADDYVYTYDNSYEYDGALRDSEVNSATNFGNRPSSGSAEEGKTFVGSIDDIDNGADEGTELDAPAVEHSFNRCRVCDDMTASDCLMQSPVPCYDYYNDQTDDRACQVTMRTRWRRGGDLSVNGGYLETLYTSRCVTPQACEDDMRQNFVETGDSVQSCVASGKPLSFCVGGKFVMNQCKQHDKLNRRFDHSECTMCTKLAGGDAPYYNAFMPSADQAFQVLTTDSAPVDVSLETVQNNPWDYMLTSNAEKLGQSFASGSYEDVRTFA